VFAGQDKRSSYVAALYTVILSEVEGSVKLVGVAALVFGSEAEGSAKTRPRSGIILSVATTSP
jgi:hypothetical protein